MDWNNSHKFRECKHLADSDVVVIFDKLSGSTNDMLRLAFKLALKCKFDPTVKDQQFTLYDGRKRKVDELMSHRDNHVNRNPWLVPFANVLVVKNIFSDTAEFLTRYGQVATNCFDMEPNYYAMYYGTKEHEEYNYSAAAICLHIEASIFDHSCRANTSRTFEGMKMVIRATREIDTDKEQLYVSYGNELLSRSERQEFYLNNYFFECMCTRCTSEMCDDGICARLSSLYNRCGATATNPGDTYKAALEAYQLSKQVLGSFSDLGMVCLMQTKMAMKAAGMVSREDLKEAIILSQELRMYIYVTRCPELPLYAKYLEAACHLGDWYAQLPANRSVDSNAMVQ